MSFAQPTSQLRHAALCLALAIYAIAGTPTPEQFSSVEITLAVLLTLSVGIEAALRPFGVGRALPPPLIAGQTLLLYGLFIPVIGGVLNGNTPILILRDIIPFLFFLLPLFCADHVQTLEKRKMLLGAALFIGIAFSVRDGARFLSDFGAHPIFQPLAADPLSYLANAPTVLLGALFLTGTAGRIFLESTRLRDLLRSIGLLLLALVPFGVMALSLQRASIGMSAMIFVLWIGGAVLYKPARSLRLVVPGALVIALFGPFLSGLLEQLSAKTSAVGFNNRFEEIRAIWTIISGNPLTLLFGTGWGGSFSSPAVGGMNVNFAHSLPAAMLLKTGLAGCFLMIFYLGSFFRPWLNGLRTAPVLALSLAAPLLIDSLLYAAYKSLDFGIILLLVAGMGHESKTANPSGKD